MDRILNAGFKLPANESVLIQSSSARAGTPAFDAAVKDVVAGVSKTAAVQNVRTTTVAKDKQAALVEFEIRGDKNTAGDRLGPVLKSVDKAQGAHPGFFIGEFGGASAAKAVDTAFADDLKNAGLFSVPLTLIILLVAFGALVAAGIPLLLALTAVFATFGLLALPSHLLPLAQEAFAVVLLIGLAVGVDYSLFYLKREREERVAGRSERAALEAAAATSGRSVLVSGLTVMVAMAGMLFTGDQTFMGFGVATMIVVAIAVLGSLTVLPATLAALGDRVERLRIPFLHKRSRSVTSGRVWSAILDRVLRRPLVSAVLAGGLLLALAAPALHMHIAEPGIKTFPQNLSSVKTYNKLQKAFPGEANSSQVLVKTDNAHSAAVTNAIADLKSQAIATGQFSTPTQVDYSDDGTIAVVSLSMQGDGVDDKALAALQTLRHTIIPATVGKLDGADVGVTGNTAGQKDTNGQMKHAAPFVFAFVLTLAFLLMLVTFRSVVVATKAVLLNLLSVAAAYGALVLVFQNGWGKGPLGFVPPGGIISWLPIFLFVILFGLSMDYHVFILSRVREAFDRGMSTEDAVAHGIKTTAGVVTSAALVMVGVFSIFATLQFLFLKEFGVGLAIAVLVDATIVRAVLLPATMKLLGDWNWYLPKWLEWLPSLEHGDSTDSAAKTPVALTPAIPQPADA